MSRPVLSPYLPQAPLTHERRALFEQYQRLAFKRALRAQKRYGGDFMVLQTASLIGLMCAAERYRTPSPASFLTFASSTIDWTIRFIVMGERGYRPRKNKPHKRIDFEPSAYRACGEMPEVFFDAEGDHADAVLVDDKTPEELLEVAQREFAAQRILTELEGKVKPRNVAMLRRHLDGEPLARIAPDFGVSRERVRQIVEKTLKQARAIVARAA